MARLEASVIEAALDAWLAPFLDVLGRRTRRRWASPPAVPPDESGPRTRTAAPVRACVPEEHHHRAPAETGIALEETDRVIAAGRALRPRVLADAPAMAWVPPSAGA